MDLAGSRKTYPSFVGGRVNAYRSASPALADGKPPLHFSSIRGVAYKKYFLPAASQEGSSSYTVEYNGDTYLYLDFFGKKSACQSWSIPADCQAVLVEASDGIRWEIQPACITAQGEAGYAVFKITPVQKS